MAKDICCFFPQQEAQGQLVLQGNPLSHARGLTSGPLESSSGAPGVRSAQEQVGGWGEGALEQCWAHV